MNSSNNQTEPLDKTAVMRRIIEIIDEYNFENVNIELNDNLQSDLDIYEDVKCSLQSDLENEWCINIPSIDFYNTDTVQDVVDIVMKYVA